MAIARRRTFRSGNSEALRLPKDVAFGEDVELVIVRSGDVLTIYPASVTDAAADAYATIVHHTGYSRRKLLDRMIAAQALVHRATLVTLNADDCRDIPGLSLEAW